MRSVGWMMVAIALLVLVLLPSGMVLAGERVIEVRTGKLKLYAEPKKGKPELVIKKTDFAPTDVIDKKGKAWLRVEHAGKKYWIKSFQVKTDTSYSLSTRGGCDRIAASANNYGGNRGFDGSCKK